MLSFFVSDFQKKTQIGVYITAVAAIIVFTITFQALPNFNPDQAQLENPILWMAGVLIGWIGFPILVISTNATLFQIWYAAIARSTPYSLFAASNLGSLSALFFFPLVFEPYVGNRMQYQLWRGAVIIFLVVVVVALIFLYVREKHQLLSEKVKLNPQPHKALRTHVVLRWLLISFVPASLMLSCNYPSYKRYRVCSFDLGFNAWNLSIDFCNCFFGS